MRPMRHWFLKASVLNWILDPAKQTLERYVLSNRQDVSLLESGDEHFTEQTFELRQKLTKRGTCESVVVEGFTIELAELFA